MTTRLKKLTPVLVVDDLAPCVAFWTERLGFQKQVEVPGFAILVRDAVEIMLETRATLREDIPLLADVGGTASLYVEVTDLDALDASLKDVPRVFPRRQTPYGMDEIAVRDPAGHLVLLAKSVK